MARKLVCFAHYQSAFPVYPCTRIERDVQMIRKGVEFTVVEAQPGLWKWSFRIGETVKTGKTETNLMGMAAHRVQQRIDLELRKPRNLIL